MANQVSVINSSYCAPHSVTLQINTEEGATYNEKDDRVFYTDNSFFTIHNRRVLYDDEENPIVTLYSKVVPHASTIPILQLISFITLIFANLQK